MMWITCRWGRTCLGIVRTRIQSSTCEGVSAESPSECLAQDSSASIRGHCFSTQYVTTQQKPVFQTFILKINEQVSSTLLLIIANKFSFTCSKSSFYQELLFCWFTIMSGNLICFWWGYLFCWKSLPIYSVSRSFRKLSMKHMT